MKEMKAESKYQLNIVILIIIVAEFLIGIDF